MFGDELFEPGVGVLVVDGIENGQTLVPRLLGQVVGRVRGVEYDRCVVRPDRPQGVRKVVEEARSNFAKLVGAELLAQETAGVHQVVAVDQGGHDFQRLVLRFLGDSLRYCGVSLLILASGRRQPPGSEIEARLGYRATFRGLMPSARQEHRCRLRARRVDIALRRRRSPCAPSRALPSLDTVYSGFWIETWRRR